MKAVLTGIALYAMFFGGYFKGYLGPLGAWITGHYGWSLMTGVAILDFCGALLLHYRQTGRWWWQQEPVKESASTLRPASRRPHFVIPSELETGDATESEFNIELSETRPKTLPPPLPHDNSEQQAGGGAGGYLPPLSRPEIVVESEYSHDDASEDEDWFEEEQPAVVDKMPQDAQRNTVGAQTMSVQGRSVEDFDYDDKNVEN